jgi:20S proteasome alpha/beta subunit
VHSHSPTGSLSGCVANNIFFNFLNSQIQERFGGQPLTTGDVVQMISGIVYNRRFNSCIDTNILGGIDVNGYGSVFRYDDVGRFKRVAYAVDGPEQVYIENFLLNSRSGGLTKDMIIEILQNAFISATARELETGEQLEILIITSTGIQRVMQDL